MNITDTDIGIKGEVHSKRLIFLSSLKAGKHSAFPLTAQVPAILKKLVSKEATLEAAILKLSWQSSRDNVT